VSGPTFNCGHARTSANFVRDGGDRVRCRACVTAKRRAKGIAPIEETKSARRDAAAAKRKPCCRDCGIKLNGSGNVSGLCRVCFSGQSAEFFRYQREHKVHGAVSCIETATSNLLIAIRREHPAIVDHLTRRQVSA
jgi:hypothetical protein